MTPPFNLRRALRRLENARAPRVKPLPVDPPEPAPETEPDSRPAFGYMIHARDEADVKFVDERLGEAVDHASFVVDGTAGKWPNMLSSNGFESRANLNPSGIEAIQAYAVERGKHLNWHLLAAAKDKWLPDGFLKKATNLLQEFTDHADRVLDLFDPDSVEVANELFVPAGGEFRESFDFVEIVDGLVAHLKNVHEFNSSNLYVNDFGTELNEEKRKGAVKLVKSVKAREGGSMGFGWQLHNKCFMLPTEDAWYDAFSRAFADVAPHCDHQRITELDLSLRTKSDPTAQGTEQDQRNALAGLLRAVAENDFHSICSWGLHDGKSFQYKNNKAKWPDEAPLFFDADGEPKELWWMLKEATR